MFLGEYRHAMDEKGRLTVPARYRQLLEDEGGYITQGIDPNLLVWRKETFEQIADAIGRLAFTDREAREFGRMFFSGADRVQPDSSGRILIPQFLRDRQGLNGEVVLAGSNLYFEIWSPTEWVRQTEKQEKIHQNADYFAKLNVFLTQPK